MSAPKATKKAAKRGPSRPAGTSPGAPAAGAGPGSVLRLTQVLPPARLWTLVVCLVLGAAAGIGAYLQPPRADPLHPPRFASPLAETWDSFLRPVERNAVFRMPRIADDLGGVAFAKDGKHGWAVGRFGVIFATTDGGASWMRQYSGPPARSPDDELRDVAVSADGSHVWVAGGPGILRTSDGGAHWTTEPVGNANLLSIAMSEDGRTGYAVGLNATVLETTDGGEHWETAEIGLDPAIDLHAVAVGRDGRSWIAGVSGLILKRENGGRWGVWKWGLDVDLWGLAISADGRNVWVAGDQGRIASLSDLGTAPQKRSAAPNLVRLIDIAVSANGQRIVASGDRETIVASSDGGQTWSHWTGGGSASFYGLAMSADLQQGFAVGNEGTVLRTDDGGRNWQPLTLGGTDRLSQVSVSADGASAWAVGKNRTILKSEDGGASWLPVGDAVETTTAQPREYGGSVQEIHGTVSSPASTPGSSDTAGSAPPQEQAFDPKNAAQESQASNTPSKGDLSLTDSFAQQQALAPPEQQQQQQSQQPAGAAIDAPFGGPVAYSGVWVAPDGSIAAVVGERGHFLRTEDGGKSWITGSVPQNFDLLGVGFDPAGKQGWAFQLIPPSLRTEDGGKTWSEIAAPQVGAAYLPTANPDAKRLWVAAPRPYKLYASDDGGRTWTSHGRWPPFEHIGMSADGKVGLAASGTEVQHTSDGGQTWAPSAGVTFSDPHDLFLSDDGRRCWIAGGGFIAASGDGGATWHDQYRDQNADLASIAMSESGERGIAVGDGTILATADGGATWSDATRYRRYPAPWLYVSWLLIGLVGRVVWVRATPRREADFETIGDDMDSDQPVLRLDQDKLDFTPIVAALSDFIRNEETKPPVTIAINGDWGTGKSSLMSMLADSLRRAGGYPVWFNAWHHQSEQLTLVPFLQHVCTQAVPPTLSRAGLRFHLRLAWRRSLRRPVNLAVVLFLTAVPAAYFAFHDPASVFSAAALDALKHDLAAMLRPFFFDDLDSAEKWVDGWTDAIEVLFNPTAGIVFWLLLLLVPGTVLALDALRAFPEVPAILFATLQDKFRLSDAEAQASFRQNFSRHFDDVVHALHPQPVVVFVDDIDRCTKENAMEMLEAANFLVNAGPCFVILGLARERVEALVGLANAEFAEETALTAGADAKDSRRAYARQYLEKLVQVEITVPTARPEDLLRVLGVDLAEDGETGDAPPPPRPAAPRPAVPKPPAWIGHERQIVAGCCALIALAAAIWLGRILPEPAPPLPPPSEAVATQETPAATPKAQTGTQPGSQPAPETAGTGGVDRPGQSGFAAMSFLPWLLLILAGGIVMWRILQTPENVIVRNSPAYKRAVAEWRKLIVGRRSTPRAVKQFGNMARYAAMMMRTEDERVEITRSVTLNDRRRGDVPGAGLNWDRIAERDVSAVTLSAIYHAEPELLRTDPNWLFREDWREQLQSLVAEARGKFMVGADPLPPLEQARWQQRLSALELIDEALTDEWPPRDLDAVRKFFKYVVVTFAVDEEEVDRGPTAA